MLAYITIGTNDFQRAVNFYDAIFNVLGYTRLPAGLIAGQCGETKIIWMTNLASAFVLLLTSNPRRREMGQCSLSEQITRTLSDASMQRASVRVGKMKACPVHEPPTAPTFMLPICAILTGINWRAFASIILLMQISYQAKKSHFNNKILL